MELKELEYIVAVAEERSISKAAERLYMAQSSLSQYVARYEAELGVKLFKRTSGGVKTTAAGELFLCGNQTASMSAALARRGLGIAFTYRSCIEENRDVIYLSIGKTRCYVNLALIYPQEGYRSRAIRAFEDALYRVLASEVF
ncbi:MAG: LysR family transcriptional regulator [Candidatus Faecousia sp.]|nr:LysR family transcriptional regulator [Candidatus Faecousia sp.]